MVFIMFGSIEASLMLRVLVNQLTTRAVQELPGFMWKEINILHGRSVS